MKNPHIMFDVKESAFCQKKAQFRFPRSKKKRIRKKWSLNDSNFKLIPTAYFFGNTLICHPSITQRLRDKFTFR